MRGYLRLAALAALVFPATAFAGPPFVTDDPEPTDLHHWEAYSYLAGTHEAGQTSTDIGLDLNYGAAKGVQLTLSLPYAKEPGAARTLGDVEVGAKYKFIEQRGNSPLAVAFFPRVVLPTGRGSTRARLLLPLWAEHDWGKWSLIGGGGYMLNPGAGQKDFWQHGIALSRQLSPGVQVGVEYYGSGPDAVGAKATHAMNLGTVIHLGGRFSLLGSAGRGLNRRQTTFYTALQIDM